MANVWDGKHFWIWNISSTLGGDVNAIVAKMKEVGARGVIVKAHDGARIWNQFRDTISAFKDAGLIVGAWGYHYGYDVQGEANAALDAISAGADWYVIDAEIEYEGKQNEASQLGQILRAEHPDYPIGYSSFPFADLHTKFPYQEFSNFCNVALPQVYWGELASTVGGCLARTFDIHAEWGIPVAPVGQTYVTKYIPTDADYQVFETVCKQYGVTGVSFWDLSHATFAMFESVKEMNFPVETPVNPVPNPDPMSYVSDWAKDSVVKVIKAGLITADDQGNFHPQDPVTREQLAVILDRAGVLDAILKVKGLI